MTQDETQCCPQCRPARVYTDSPAEIRLLTGGQVELTPQCNTFITWATKDLRNPEAEGCLAVRWTCNGQRFFESAGRRYVVDDHTYLPFNEGRAFSSYVRSETLVHCFTVCFQPDMAADVLRSLVTPADQLLDDPQGSYHQPVRFLEKAYPHDRIVTPVLRDLQRLRDTDVATHGWFDEQFRHLLVGLLQAHRKVFAEVENLPIVRAGTRLEVYRRLHRARDFMEANLDQPLMLSEIAAAAYFSPHHFLRLFKHVFQETPHQYLTRRRLEQAQHLLRNTDRSVTDICFAVGFESLGSFSWLFRNRLGVSPEMFRAQARRRIMATVDFDRELLPRAG